MDCVLRRTFIETHSFDWITPGGQNVQKVLSLRGLFTKAGAYTIKIKLIDRDSSDAEIASKIFSFTAITEEQNNNQTNNSGADEGTNNSQTENITNPVEENNVNNQKENLPETLPKTGKNIYIPIIILAITLINTGVVLQRKNKF